MTNHRRQNGDTPRTPRYEYEAEANVRRAWGSVAVGDGVCWRGEVVVPMDGERALITVERSPEETGPSEATLGVLFEEIDAVLALLTGIVDQARNAGVLTEPPGRLPGKGTGTRQRRATTASPLERATRPPTPLKIEHGER
jgi:hypothetical protein